MSFDLVASARATRRVRIMQSIKVCGEVTAAVAGAVYRRVAAALAGLAPYPDDSGKRMGQRHVKGGRILLRNILPLAATAAIRFNPDMKNFDEGLIGEGRSHKIALTAVMRKPVMFAKVLGRDDRARSPAAPEPNAGKASACEQPCGQVRDNCPVTGQDPRNRPWVGLNPNTDATLIEPVDGVQFGKLRSGQICKMVGHPDFLGRQGLASVFRQPEIRPRAIS